MKVSLNLLANCDEHIGDDDVFATPAMLTTRIEIRAWYKGNLTK